MNDNIDEIVTEALKRSDEGQSLTAYLRSHPIERDEVDAILGTRVRIERVGARLRPRSGGLCKALGLTEPEPVLSPLFINSFIMNSASKITAGVLALVVVVGGGYVLTMPGEQLVMESDSAPVTADESTAAETSMVVSDTSTAPTAATGSISEISAAIVAELAAENAGLASFDQDVNAEVAATEALTSTSDMNYDESI